MADTNGIPEIERRKKETGIIGHVVETLIGKQSRKVAFGIWVFIVANGMRERHADMPWDLWWKAVLLSGALIGLGTVLDDTIAKFGELIAIFSADKVKAVFAKKTETTVVSTETPAPPGGAAVIAVILKYLTPRDYVIGGLVVAIVACATLWHKDAVALKQAKLVYENPAVKTVEKIVYRTGPVRIKTVVVKEKDGTEVTTTEEERAGTSSETVNASETAPVPLSIALAQPRTDRYLLSAGLNRLTADFDGKALFVGYGWKNRFDLQVGAVKHDGTSPWMLATFRF